MESKSSKQKEAAATAEQEFFDDDETEATSSKTGTGELKKKSSYTYWVQNNRDQFPQSKDKELIAPKKIDDPELLK